MDRPYIEWLHAVYISSVLVLIYLALHASPPTSLLLIGLATYLLLLTVATVPQAEPLILRHPESGEELERIEFPTPLHRLVYRILIREPRLVSEAGVFEVGRYVVSRVSQVRTLLLIVPPISILLSIILGSPLPLILLVLPVLPVLLIPLHLRILRWDRRLVENEVGLLTLQMYLYASTGLGLLRILEHVVRQGVLRRVSIEAEHILRHIRMGGDIYGAVKRVVERHPSHRFRQLLLGYTAVASVGGDIPSYLEERMNQYLHVDERRAERYRGQADTLFGIHIIISLGVSVSTPFLMMLYGQPLAILVPATMLYMASTLLIMFVGDWLRPLHPLRIRHPPRYVLLALLPSLILGYSLHVYGAGLGIVLNLPTLLFWLVLYTAMRRVYREAGKTVERLGEALREMGEMMKVGMGFHPSYRRYVEVLRGGDEADRLGTYPSATRHAETLHYWTGDEEAMTKTLAQMEEIGGVGADTVTRVAEYFETRAETMREIRGLSLLFIAVYLVIPILTLWVVGFLVGLAPTDPVAGLPFGLDPLLIVPATTFLLWLATLLTVPLINSLTHGARLVAGSGVPLFLVLLLSHILLGVY